LNSRNHDAASALSKLLSNFPSTSIINLKRRADRRRRVTAQIHSLGIDMNQAGVLFFEAKSFVTRGLFVNSGVRGCFESHLALLQMCARSNQPLLICEDDVYFEEPALTVHHSAGFDLPTSGWDIIYFGLCEDRLEQHVGFVPYQDFATGLHCYAIQPDAAELAAKYFSASLSREPAHPDGGCKHPDGAMNDFRRKNPDVRCFIASPMIATQFASRTDLGTQKWFDHIRPLRPAIDSLRRIRAGKQLTLFK
jgi:glycosyl transferase, family 25